MSIFSCDNSIVFTFFKDAYRNIYRLNDRMPGTGLKRIQGPPGMG